MSKAYDFWQRFDYALPSLRKTKQNKSWARCTTKVDLTMPFQIPKPKTTEHACESNVPLKQMKPKQETVDVCYPLVLTAPPSDPGSARRRRPLETREEHNDTCSRGRRGERRNKKDKKGREENGKGKMREGRAGGSEPGASGPKKTECRSPRRKKPMREET